MIAAPPTGNGPRAHTNPAVGLRSATGGGVEERRAGGRLSVTVASATSDGPPFPSAKVYVTWPPATTAEPSRLGDGDSAEGAPVVIVAVALSLPVTMSAVRDEDGHGVGGNRGLGQRRIDESREGHR